MTAPFSEMVAIGRVVKPQGRTADAIRTVIEAVGRKRGIDCDVEILD